MMVSYAGLTRVSIDLREKRFQMKMGCRVKPGNDAGRFTSCQRRRYFKDALSASNASFRGGRSSLTAFQIIEASTRW
jgi:hypothetical protein